MTEDLYEICEIPLSQPLRQAGADDFVRSVMAPDSVSDWFHGLTPLNSSSSSINSDFIKIDKNHVSTIAVVHNADTPARDNYLREAIVTSHKIGQRK